MNNKNSRTNALPGLTKKSPLENRPPIMPKDHPVKPPKQSSDYKTKKYDGPKVIGGSAPNPAKSAVNLFKGAKKVYKKLRA